MRTLYAIASRFAGPGIGRTASNAALGLWRKGYLKKLVCLGHEKTDIDEDIISDVPFIPRGALRFISDKPFYEIKNKWFDFLCKGHLGYAYDTFHCWNSQTTGSLENAKKQGVLTVLDRASSHILTQTEILQDQYDRHGIRFDPTYPHVIERCLREYDLTDILVTPSPFAYNSFAEQGFDMSKVLFNPFGVDLDAFTPRESLPKDFTVIFVGQIGIRKGIPALLKAWDLLSIPGAKLYLVGTEEQVAEPILRPYLNREDIVFTGFLKNVGRVISSSSVFVFPSCEEGSALVTYEAMACGVPLVVTENSGSLVKDGVSGFVIPPNDPEAIAQCLERLYKDPDFNHQMGTAARQGVEQYPWDAYGERTALLHEGLAARLPAHQIQKSMGIDFPT